MKNIPASFGLSERQTVGSGLDEISRRLVQELSRDGRMSMRTLAERLHISRANAYSRVEKLTRDGVIRGFSARIDPSQVGLATSAYITLRIEQNSWKDVSEHLRRLPAIHHFALVGGDFDVIALARVADQAGLRHLVLDQLQTMPGITSTHTLLIFEESPDDVLP
jgi:DNA-binding Lrp family transcriptional regulator